MEDLQVARLFPGVKRETGTKVSLDIIPLPLLQAQYARSKGLGGVMVWDVTTDDFRNLGGEGKSPLVTAMYRTLRGF